MKKLKNLFVSTVLSLGVSSLPAGAVPCLSEYNFSKMTERLNIMKATKYRKMAVKRIYIGSMLEALDNEEDANLKVAMLISYIMNNMLISIDTKDEVCNFMNFSNRVNRNNLKIFSKEWMLTAEYAEIEEEVRFLMDCIKSENLIIKHFGFPESLAEEKCFKTFCAVLRSIESFYFVIIPGFSTPIDIKRPENYLDNSDIEGSDIGECWLKVLNIKSENR